MPMRCNNILAAGLAVALLLASESALAKKGKAAPAMAGQTAMIELPPGDDVLPDRPGAEAVDRNCLSCHSTETILNQPALSRDIWQAEIGKMRTNFNAQISPDADEAILAYLTSINGVRRDRWR
jgi:cytochrome c5